MGSEVQDATRYVVLLGVISWHMDICSTPKGIFCLEKAAVRQLIKRI